MNIYNVEYTKMLDGTILVQYKKHEDDNKNFKPTYQALVQDMTSAIKYINKLNNLKNRV